MAPQHGRSVVLLHVMLPYCAAVRNPTTDHLIGSVHLTCAYSVRSKGNCPSPFLLGRGARAELWWRARLVMWYSRIHWPLVARLFLDQGSTYARVQQHRTPRSVSPGRLFVFWLWYCCCTGRRALLLGERQGAEKQSRGGGGAVMMALTG